MVLNDSRGGRGDLTPESHNSQLFCSNVEFGGPTRSSLAAADHCPLQNELARATVTKAAGMFRPEEAAKILRSLVAPPLPSLLPSSSASVSQSVSPHFHAN